MKIWKRVQNTLPNSQWKKRAGQKINASTERVTGAAKYSLQRLRNVLPEKKPLLELGAQPVVDGGAGHLGLARDALRQLLDDPKVPAVVRDALAEDYQHVQVMLDKLEHEHIHIAVFGRVSVGKSALLNALLGEQQFETSPLHGMTRSAQLADWDEYAAGNVYLIDTPGINEIKGEARERLAHDVSERSDLVLFVVDGDLTDTELQALKIVAEQNRPVVLVLNKADSYTQQQRALLLDSLKQRTQDLLQPEHIVTTSAHPAERIYIERDEQGEEQEIYRTPPADTQALRELLFKILDAEGKMLVALNASLFAGQVSDQVAKRLTEAKRMLADKMIRSHCVIKGAAVAVNPIPVADLVAAMAVDVALVINLGKLYGMPVTRSEAGRVIRTIGAQMALIMGSVWGVHLVSSLLKTTSFGLSTLVTATAQGAVAYYGTYIIGQAAERYFAQGKSWGEAGAKSLVQNILNSLDRDSILEQARDDIMDRVKTNHG